jgi:osmoprotectant transport system substrate-binding protein
MSGTRTRWAGALATMAAAAIGLTACGGLEQSGPSASGGSLAQSGVSLEGKSYNVGGKDFDEQLVLCQIAVAALEAAKATATDKCNTGGTDVTRQALVSGQIDLYWEYTGTAWVSFFKQTPPIPDEEKQYQATSDFDLKQNKIHWLGRTPFNNTYAFAVTADAAQKNNLASLDDMAAYIKAGKPGQTCIETEYAARDDGFSGLQKTYGFSVAQPLVLQTGAIYQATADGKCMFGEVFTTDGRIPALNLKVLTDDKHYHPNYNASVTVSDAAFQKDPNIGKVFEPIEAALDNTTMADLNKQVSKDGKNPRDVARAWMKEKGFISG